MASGPAAIAILSNVALVLNSDTDNVSILNLTTRSVTGIVDVGRAPRGIGSETTTGSPGLAFVTNQSDGTISVINLTQMTQMKVVDTLKLGADVRPQSILVLPGIRVGVVTEPDRHETGRVMLVDLNTGSILADVDVNPDRSGGASEMAFFEGTVYFTNQSGGSVTAAKVIPPSGAQTSWALAPRTIKAGIGARALAIDQIDRLLLVTNQGSGEVVLIDLNTNQIAGRINAVRSEDEDDGKHDDHGDRDRAANAPVISSLAPNKVTTRTPFTMTIYGKNFTGASEVVFLDPESLPGQGKGRGNSGDHGKGPSGRKDPAFTVTNLQATATQVTVNVAITAAASKGERLVRVLTPNGESSSVMSSANTFTVVQ
jgi:YVTN family beta-propeller protein